MKDDRTHMDGEPETTSTSDEVVTSPEIRRGMIIGLRASAESWAATVEVEPDTDATPIVAVPLIPRMDSNAPPPSWSSDTVAEEATTRRWFGPSVPPPPEDAPPTQRTRRSPRAGFVATAATVAGLVAIALVTASSTSHRRSADGGRSVAVAAPPMAVAMAAPQTAPPSPAVVTDKAPDALAPPSAEPAPITLEIVDTPPAPQPPTDRLVLAHDALVHGRWRRAESYYAELTARDPNDVEALTGLGDVARARGDVTRATAMYARALQLSPAFLPARIGLADTHWNAGDRARAIAEYKTLVEDFAHLPRYVAARATADGRNTP